MVHEFERALVSAISRLDRAKKAEDVRKLFGDVRVHGAPVMRESSDSSAFDSDDEEPECIICAAPARAMRPRSYSNASVASNASFVSNVSRFSNVTAASAAHIASLGPLEAFCTTAPQKHLAHRKCFLTWHATYSQTHAPILGPVALRLEENAEAVAFALPSSSRATISVHASQTEVGPSHLARAKAILSSTPGFGYLASLLHILPPGTMDGPELIVHSGGPSRSLATLRTAHPPCPGCRSAVALQFSAATAPRQRAPRDLRIPQIILDLLAQIPEPAQAYCLQAFNTSREKTRSARHLLRAWAVEWTQVVGGRGLLSRVVGQALFLAAIMGVLRGRRARESFTSQASRA